jgi:hypothetical protein
MQWRQRNPFTDDEPEPSADPFGTDGAQRAGLGNHWHDDPEPPEDTSEGDGPTTWEPVDLTPWLRGDIEIPHPVMGIARSDGQRIIYPGCEHVVFGGTESGKSWLVLGCVAAEIAAGNHVVYIHYEEGPANTVERLTLLGVTAQQLTALLHFVGPLRAAHREWVAALLSPTPTLVVHDGVNEAMALHGYEIVKDPSGASSFRRTLVVPFLRAGAASIACDHTALSHDATRRDAYGSVHKGNALDGARFLLENTAPFGRGMRGASHLYVTKDRPGWLRAQGRPSNAPGKTFMGTLVVDDADPFAPLSMAFYAPRDDSPEEARDPAAQLADTVYDVIAASANRTVKSQRELCALLRATGAQFRTTTVRDAVDDLVVARRLIEVPGKRNGKGYRAVSTASQAPAGEDSA